MLKTAINSTMNSSTAVSVANGSGRPSSFEPVPGRAEQHGDQPGDHDRDQERRAVDQPGDQKPHRYRDERDSCEGYRLVCALRHGSPPPVCAGQPRQNRSTHGRNAISNVHALRSWCSTCR